MPEFIYFILNYIHVFVILRTNKILITGTQNRIHDLRYPFHILISTIHIVCNMWKVWHNYRKLAGNQHETVLAYTCVWPALGISSFIPYLLPNCSAILLKFKRYIKALYYVPGSKYLRKLNKWSVINFFNIITFRHDKR